MNNWTKALAIAGIVSMAAFVNAEEAENQVLTTASGTTISGYVDTSANFQFGSRKTDMAGMNNRADHQNGFNLNAVQIGIGKSLEDDSAAWSAGYQADLLFGSESAFYGRNLGANSDIALQNAYVDLRAPIGNGLDFRFGVFESIVGYESTDSYKNPNFARSFGMMLQPRQHTGGLVSYNFDVNDWILGVRGGIANTYDNVGNINRRSTLGSGRLTYMGAINLIFPESTGFMEGTEIYFGIVSGLGHSNGTETGEIPAGEFFNTDHEGNISNYYAGVTLPLPVTGLSFGFSYDYRCRNSNDTEKRSYHNEGQWANAFAGYLVYDVTDKLTFANRLEFMNASDTTMVYLYRDPSFYGDDAEILSDTFTVSYKLWENVITRAEFQWTHDCSGSRKAAFDTATGEFDRANAYGVTANIVYVF